MASVLVAYASKRGSTAEIAETIAEVLRDGGLQVDCVETGDVDTIAAYDAVVLGSAVYMKRWRGDAKHFLKRHTGELAQLPLWVFSSGPVGDPVKDNPAWEEPPRIVSTVERLGARAHVVFGGRVPADPHGPMERSMADGIPPEYRDRRDWGEIGAWAEGIAAELRVSAPAV